MNKVLGTLGLCRRAGKLIYGFDAVTSEIKGSGGLSGGVVLSSDLSAKSEKEVRFVCDKYGVPVCKTDAAMDELKKIVGKHTGILAVLDKGLFNSIDSNSKKSEKPGDIE